MAYDLMKKLIAKGKSREELIRKCDKYYACDQLTDDEYTELMEIINRIN